jgi:predicted amidohydrolase
VGVGVVVAQVPVDLSVTRNLKTILEVLIAGRPGDVVVTPEGSLTGYPVNGPADLDRLSTANPRHVAEGVDTLAVKRLNEAYTCGSVCADSGTANGRTRRSASSPIVLG